MHVNRTRFIRSDPATTQRERLLRMGGRLRELSREWVQAVRRNSHHGEVVIGKSAVTTDARERSDHVMLPARATIDALHAEIAGLRVDNDDLRASARLWADLYEQAGAP